MNRNAAAPLALGLVLQGVLLVFLIVLAGRAHNPSSFADSEHRFAEYATLYEASSNRDYAYAIANNHFTPVAILGNASLTVLPRGAATVVFEGFSVLALAAAGWLMIKALGVDEERRNSQRIYVLAVLLALSSAPLFHILYFGTIDAFVLLLVAAAVFLMTASQVPEQNESSGSLRRNLDVLAGAALAFAAGLNPICVVLVLPALLLRRFRVLGGTLVGLAIVYVVSPTLWAEYAAHNVAMADFWYTGPQNASILSALHLFTSPATKNLIPYPQPPLFTASVIAAVAVLITIFMDLKSGRPADERGQSVRFASYIPFVFALPMTLSPQALSLDVLMLPVFIALWNAGEHALQRVGLGIAMAGWALTQSYSTAWEPGRGMLFANGVQGLGTLLLIGGLIVGKAGLFACRAGSIRSLFVARPGQRAIHFGFAAIAFTIFISYYARHGYNTRAVCCWLLALALLYSGLLPAPGQNQIRRLKFSDWRCVAALLLVFSVPYLLKLHDYPVQVNTDEISAIMTMDRMQKQPTDWFGVDPGYDYFPSGSFKLIGVLSHAFGGVTLEHVRQVNALFGLACIAAAYCLFRQFYRKRLAFIVALLLGASHVLLGLSRMAIRDNLPLLIELAALTLLVSGWRRRNFALLLLGGIVAGLGVYNYFSARIAIIVWFGFLLLYFITRPTRACAGRILSTASVCGLGYAVCAAPMFLATFQAPADALDYPKAQVVLYPQGREIVREWEGTTDTTLSLLRNAGKGLTMFNNNLADHSNIYCNPGFGFVDPITGALLWLGVIRLLRKRSRTVRDLLALAGFALWIPLILLLTKNPAFSRMLIILPFAIVLALDGARIAAIWLALLFAAHSRRQLRSRIAFLLIAGICGWNGWAYASHIRRGIANGDAPGNTTRYAEARRTIPNYAFYIVMDDRYPYFWFGKDAWQRWVQFFAAPEQKVALLKSQPLLDSGNALTKLQRPCSLFLSGKLFQKCSARLAAQFPGMKVQQITANGEQLVLDLP